MARKCDRCGTEIKRYGYQYVDDEGNHFCRKCTDVKVKALDMMVRHRRLKTEWMGEVVTCANCKFYHEETNPMGMVFRECHAKQWWHPEAPYPEVKPDAFCSFGQRKMTEEEEWQEK